MAFYRLYLIQDTFQILSSQGRDLLDAAKRADAQAKQAEALAKKHEEAGQKDEAAAKMAEVESAKAEAAAKRKEASVFEQRIGEMIDGNAEKFQQDTIAGKPPDTSNPFPEWVQELIKELGGGKAKFDEMNAEYKLRTAAEDKEQGDEEWAMFEAKLTAAAKENPERLKWHTSHHVQCSTVFEDEKEEMDKLERYLGGNPDGATKKTRR